MTLRYKVLAFALPFGLLIATGVEAQAAVPTYAQQDLIFVSDSQIQGPGGNTLALCVLSETTAVLHPSLHLWRKAKAYALSEANCTGTAYYDITPEGIALAKSIGQLPRTVPDHAQLPLSQLAGGWWGSGVISLLVLIGAAAKLRRTIGARRQPKVDPIPLAILTAMCQAARADGRRAEAGIGQILQAAPAFTGARFTRAQVQGLMQRTAPPGDGSLSDLVASVPATSHAAMMAAVLHVIGADGEVHDCEWDFVTRLADAMQMPAKTLNRLVAEMARGQGTPQPRAA